MDRRKFLTGILASALPLPSVASLHNVHCVPTNYTRESGLKFIGWYVRKLVRESRIEEARELKELAKTFDFNPAKRWVLSNESGRWEVVTLPQLSGENIDRAFAEWRYAGYRELLGQRNG